MKANSFKTKIIVSTTIVFLIILVILVTYNSISRKNSETKHAIESSNLITEKLAGDLKIKIDYSFDILRVFTDDIVTSKSKLDRETINNMLLVMLKNNPEFLATYVGWEPNAFDNLDTLFIDKPGHDATGRYIPYFARNDASEIILEPLTAYDTEGEGDYFLIPKRTKKECMIDPYSTTVNDKVILMISVVVPILIDSEFQGVTGIDYGMSFMQNEALALQSKIFDGKANIEIFSNKGIIVASTLSPDSIGKSIVELKYENADELLKNIQTGASETGIITDNLVITKSFLFGKTDTPWQIRFTVPYSEITKSSNQAILYSIIAGLILLIIGLTIVYLLIAKLTEPLNRLVEQTIKITTGDLTGKIEILQNDEIGLLANSFNTMIEKLKEIISTVLESANNLTAGTNQIAASANQIAQGASEQASSSEEVSSSIEEMVSTIMHNTENAVQTEKFSQEGATGIMEIANSSKKSLDAVNKIADKTSIIDEIAQKTNILALNAAIEAARAGQHGKGFAVVADEVRKLAEISQEAAKDISDLSTHILELTHESGILMSGIIPNIQKTAKLVNEIASASSEQNTGSQQISRAIDQLSKVTQQNAAAAEEMSSSSEELASQAETLKDAIMFFKIDQVERNFIKPEKVKHIEMPVNKPFIKKPGVTLDLFEKDNKDSEFEQF